MFMGRNAACFMKTLSAQPERCCESVCLNLFLPMERIHFFAFYSLFYVSEAAFCKRFHLDGRLDAARPNACPSLPSRPTTQSVVGRLGSEGWGGNKEKGNAGKRNVFSDCAGRKERGVQQGKEYAILTDEITKAWSGMTTRQYKKLKGLKKENLRDNMSTMEIVLNMLAEATTTELSKAHQPEGFSESQKIARRGGSYAGQVRQDIEKDTGRPVITSQNAAQLNAVVVDMIESVAETEKPDNDENK